MDKLTELLIPWASKASIRSLHAEVLLWLVAAEESRAETLRKELEEVLQLKLAERIFGKLFFSMSLSSYSVNETLLHDTCHALKMLSYSKREDK